MELGHCLQLLGQSIMCHPDLSLWSAEWVSNNAAVRSKEIRSNAELECVNWDMINQWALPRALQRGYKVRPGPFEHHPQDHKSYVSEEAEPIMGLGRVDE
jgi:hypothetical protein